MKGCDDLIRAVVDRPFLPHLNLSLRLTHQEGTVQIGVRKHAYPLKSMGPISLINKQSAPTNAWLAQF